jgi:hypothetical protein
MKKYIVWSNKPDRLIWIGTIDGKIYAEFIGIQKEWVAASA